ncbi:hypothetical protein ACQKOE_07460 [Novosphingobium sp. NPDC080210]|uniref:hypothetical protein n=1 Tax=Novosphingobium sp. NPDC080210 TaxID=3390596 RepID=UPI003D08F1F3
MITAKDISVGMSAGWFTIIDGPYSKNGLRWLAQCSCGEKVELNISTINAKIAKNGSCQKCRHSRGTTHGHGRTTDPTWSVWQAMKQRCTNPANRLYRRYGGRGIKVCDRWLESFEAFLEDMGERPSRDFSIERNDNDGDYSPANCRWATRKEQALNKSNTAVFSINGETVIGYAALSARVGISTRSLIARAHRGTLERIGITRIRKS